MPTVSTWTEFENALQNNNSESETILLDNDLDENVAGYDNVGASESGSWTQYNLNGVTIDGQENEIRDLNVTESVFQSVYGVIKNITFDVKYLPAGSAQLATNSDGNNGGIEFTNVEIKHQANDISGKSQAFLGQADESVIKNCRITQYDVSFDNIGGLDDSSFFCGRSGENAIVKNSYISCDVNLNFDKTTVFNGVVSEDYEGKVRNCYWIGDINISHNLNRNSIIYLIGNRTDIRNFYYVGEQNIESSSSSSLGISIARLLPTDDTYIDTDVYTHELDRLPTGLTTEEMTGQSAKTNMDTFDYDTDWVTVSETDADTLKDSYPILQSQSREEQLKSRDLVFDDPNISLNTSINKTDIIETTDAIIDFNLSVQEEMVIDTKVVTKKDGQTVKTLFDDSFEFTGGGGTRAKGIKYTPEKGEEIDKLVVQLLSDGVILSEQDISVNIITGVDEYSQEIVSSEDISEGDTLQVEYVLEQAGNIPKSGTLNLIVDSEIKDSESFLVDGNTSTQSGVLEWETKRFSSGDYVILVETEFDLTSAIITVKEPLNTEFVTLRKVKKEINYTKEAFGLDETEYNKFLQDLIRRESRRVSDEIDITFGVEKETVQLSRPRTVTDYKLPLPERPIRSLKDISVDLDRAERNVDINKSDVIVKETHLELDPYKGAFPTERRTITVEYEYGYGSNNLPKVVQGAIIGLVRQSIREIEADGVESESIEGQDIEYELADRVVERHLERARQFDEPNFYGGTQVI